VTIGGCGLALSRINFRFAKQSISKKALSTGFKKPFLKLYEKER